MSIVKRSDKVMFYPITTVSGETTTTVYKRMQGFTDMSKSHNPQEYNPHYVDEVDGRNILTGFSPTIAFGFDQMTDNDVHKDIVSIIDGEKIGTECVRSLIMVDLTTKTGSDGSETYTAYKRDFSIVPSGEGSGTDTYAYTGDFKANGVSETITGTLSADGLTFTPASE